MPILARVPNAYVIIPAHYPGLSRKMQKQQSLSPIYFCKVYDTRIFIGAGMYYLQQFLCTDSVSIARHLSAEPGNYQIGIIDAVTN